MSRFWLKVLGSDEIPCPESYTLDYVDFARRPRRMRIGDRLVLYAAGGSKRIFGLAEVTSGIRESGRERWPYRMGISYSVKLPVSSGVQLAEVNTGHRDLLLSVRQASYIELSSEEYEKAASKLQAASGDG
jgi:hypothetical protein